MTAEEFEIAYCKGRRVSTRSISNWLKEHSESVLKLADVLEQRGTVDKDEISSLF